MSSAAPFGSSTKAGISHRSLCTVWPATSTSPDVAAYASEENPPRSPEYRRLVLIKEASQSLPKNRALDGCATLIGRVLTTPTKTRLGGHHRVARSRHQCGARGATSLEIGSRGRLNIRQRAVCRDNRAICTKRRPRADRCPSPVEHNRYPPS